MDLATATVIAVGAAAKMSGPVTAKRTVVAALLTSVSLLATTPTQAQTTSYVDQLVRGSAAVTPLRGIDINTRAEKRYAIVIGNSDYSAIPDLPNAKADAAVMADFLRSQDYIVYHHDDITKRGFENVLRRILFDVDKDTEVVVFFAGHGFQIGSENYLVPVDADLDTVYDIPFEAVSLGSLVGIIGARARLQVVILDSCRDNPFAGKAAMTQLGNDLREARTGFSSQAAPLNSMLIYSTSPGALAYDGDGDNSPFTAALVTEASAKPDALIKDVFEGVRRLVYQATEGRQVPWDSSTLVEPASFGIGAAMSRPLAISSSGTGETRGLARVSNSPAPLVEVSLGQTPVATIEADFVPEVAIGPALRDALDLTPADQVTITEGPATGRFMLPRPDGTMSDVIDKALLPDEVDALILINQSVQIPALSLDGSGITDGLTLTINGQEQFVALGLTPHACDFHAGDHLDPGGMGLTRYPNELEPENARAACEEAVAADPDNPRFNYQLGRAQLALKDVDAATASFERARDLGHSRAWNALGNAAFDRAIREGQATDGKAPQHVLELFARGVEEGDPYAFYNLGRQLMDHGGTDAIEVEGYDLVMRSLEVGHTFAMNDLASFYLNEDSEFFDGERGLRYLRESASREDIYGYNGLGLAYYRGRGGLEQDDAQAYDWFTKAVDGGHPTAPYNLARMYRDGYAPGGEDMNKAVYWFAEGLARGDALAGALASYVIQTENPSDYDSFDAAIFAAKGGALQGQSEAEDALDELYGLSDRAVNGGTQRLMVELGAEITVDGAFGPASTAAFEAILADLNAGPAMTTPVDRILQLADLVWQQSAFRVDLY